MKFFSNDFPGQRMSRKLPILESQGIANCLCLCIEHLLCSVTAHRLNTHRNSLSNLLVQNITVGLLHMPLVSTVLQVIVQFKKREVTDIIQIRQILKGINMAVVEDLTTLSKKTINRLKLNNSVLKTRTWNGRIFAMLKAK
jgi:hypothetical protein